MVDPSAGKFIASLVKSLQMLCHGYMEFNDNIEIIGHINLRIDNSQKFDYIVNEQVSKQGGESTYFQSNSYHSLPPSRCGRGERERQHTGRFDDDGSVNNHHRLDDSVATFGGSRVQVDLSGPMPVTRSTSAPTPDSFFSTTSSNRCRSHSRDSRLHSVEEEQASVPHTQDHSFNHSSITSKDREESAPADSNGDERTEASIALAMFKGMDRSRQHASGQRQDIIIKAEPNERDSAMEESGQDPGILDASATSSVLPAAHQSSLAAHTGHAMLAATIGHPSFFDTSLQQQEVTEGHPGESSYRPVAIGNERGSGQDLSKQSSQNGEAMSLVTRNRTPPDLSYPTGPTQLPQTADVGGKESTPNSEKNRCDHCSKYFRTAELLSMHIALIHSHRNYMSPKSLRSNASPYSSMSPSSQPIARRASQSPGHQSTSSSSSRSKSQSPISMMSHSHVQPLALTYSHPSLPPSGGSPSTSLGMSLPTLPNTMTSTPHSSPSTATNVAAAMAAAALAQSYSMEPSQVGPLMGSQGAPTMQSSAYQCHLCHMPFVSWALLAQHQSQCPRRGPHRCEQCGKAFRSKTSLTDHINTIHRGMLFICKGCRETFKWRTHIYQHKRKCPALQSTQFESGSFFIEEMQPPAPLPPEVSPSTSMAPMAADESMDESDRVN